MALYSASVEERETADCFFIFYEMGEVPRKIQYPETDVLEVEHSESQYYFMLKSFFVRKRRPSPGVLLISHNPYHCKKMSLMHKSTMAMH